MKIAIIGSVGIPANYGGFETLVEQIVSHTQSKDITYTVYCSKKAYKHNRPDTYKGARLEYVNLHANGLQSIPYDIISMIRGVRKHDGILVLGVSGCVFLPVLRLFSKKLMVINIDGLEHRRKKWSKWARKYLKFSESLAVKHGDVIIADNKGIVDYVADQYGLPAEMIAYGGDHAVTEVSEDRVKYILDELGLQPGQYSMGLCRIEPENNVEMILESFSRMPDQTLIFIGNWDKSDYSRAMRKKYSRFPNIKIQSPIYDLEILNALRSNCKTYLHGHSAGGTNPSLVEAMFFKKPVLAFNCVYNRETTKNEAIYFDDSDDLIEKFKNESSRFDNVGTRMLEIAASLYRWEVIVRQYEDIFHRKLK